MKVCVSCQMDVEGKKALPVREDRIIRTIRSVKRALNVAQNNELFVCQDCMPKHMERRKSFEKSMLFSSVFAALILVVLVAALLLSGRFDPWALISAVIVCGFILALPIFRYAPAVEGQLQPKAAPPPVPAPGPPQLPETEKKKKIKK
jgi:energy-converting hydrogenase Eha subunit A